MIRSLIATYRQAFSGLPAEVWLLALATLIHRSGTMVMPFLSLYVTAEMGLPPRYGGYMLAAYGVGAITGAAIGGKLSDKLGAMRAQKLSLVAAGLGFFALTAADDPWTFGALVVVASLAAESFRPPNSVAIAERVTEGQSFRAFALRRLAINAGMTLGPAVGGILAYYDYFWLFVCDGATCLAAAAFLAYRFPGRGVARSEETPGDGPAPPASPWNDRPYLVLLGLVAALMIVFYQILTTYPLTLYDVFGFDERAVGLVFAINPLMIILFEMVLIDAVARFHALRVTALGALLMCLGLGILPLGETLMLVCVSIAVLTWGEMLTMPLLEGLVANRAPPSGRGSYLGLYNAAYAVSFVVGPPLGAWIYEIYGYRTLWFGCGALGIVFFLGFWLLSRRFRG